MQVHTAWQRRIDRASPSLARAPAPAQDRRKEYGEIRMICFGMLDDRMVVVGYTRAWRGSSCR